MNSSIAVVVALASMCQADAVARAPDKQAKAARLHALYLLHKGTQVWAAVRGPDDTLESDAQRLYNGRVDRMIPESE